MKISYRLLFINFIIVLLILGSSGIAFYSILNNVITSQQSKHLLKSTNTFIYQLEATIQDIDQEFFLLHPKNKAFTFDKKQISASKLDFVFQLQSDSVITTNSGYFSSNVSVPGEKIPFSEFLRNNPFVIIKKYGLQNGATLFYGRVINTDFLNTFYSRVSNDIAVVSNNKTVLTSNELSNQNLAYFLTEASKELSLKNSFDIFSKMSESADLYATIYRPNSNFIPGNINFLIFSRLTETVDLRTNLKYVMAVLGVAGLALSLILTLIFTAKLRRQIGTLNKATEITKTGNFHNRITVQSKDELGILASAFNTMLDELAKKDKINNEYSEFIALINQNPTLFQVSENALNKIIKTGGFNVGAIYNIEKDEVTLISSYGIQSELFFSKSKIDLFEPVLKKQEILELTFENNAPQIDAGLFKVEIKNLLIIPIIYNFKVIAILELGSVKKPSPDAMQYIAKIKEQLAIGLTNATTLIQLENLVMELKQLNVDYQKQNLQVKEQNETLLKLHQNLKEKAEELELQKIKAEDLTKLKSQFLASMSHELRTPLNSIIGLTELIVEDKKITGKNRERITVVLRNSRRLMKLINDILDLSKVESGKMELLIENTQLEEILTEVHESINLLAVNKNLNFTITRNCDTDIYIRTDKTKILQVLINLLSNAIKFTDEGKVTLEVFIPEAAKLQFDIIDSGIGISESDQKIIFEEFRQVDGTLTRKYSGTGLGLAICKKIALLLEGDLSVNSNIGIGSTFSFSIPLEIVSIPQKTAETNLPRSSAGKTNNLVVVVENDVDVQVMFEQYFQSKGFEVEFANNDKTGIGKIKMLQPSLITLNTLNSGNNFYDNIYALKTSPATADIPVSLVAVDAKMNLGYGFSIFDFILNAEDENCFNNMLLKLEKHLGRKIGKAVVISDSWNESDSLKTSFNKNDIKAALYTAKNVSVPAILEKRPDFIMIELISSKTDALSLSAFIKANVEIKQIPLIIYSKAELSLNEKEQLVKSAKNIITKYNYHPFDTLRTIREQIKIIEELKILDASPRAHTKAIEEETGEKEKKTDYNGVVLIVDDDPDTLYTISEIVEECKCKTVLAGNGIECLNILQTVVPDLILLDIMMPGMDGFQTINKIKENKRWAKLPVYAVTAKAMLEDKQVILNHGFDDYISKPVSSNILAFKIQKVINKT